MQSAVNQPLGGGGLLKPRAQSKMKDYCRRYYHCAPSELLRAKKLPFARLLSDVYGFSTVEIATFFNCSKATAWRMVTDARVWQKRSAQYRWQEKHIADYILYNAQWRNGVSVT